MIDRKNGPKIHTDFDLSLTGIKSSNLDNGLEIHEINAGTQSIVKVELVFRSGRIHELKRAVAKATFSLLREGSTRHKGAELAEIYDYYGAAVKTTTDMEASSISLVVLERYFPEVWPVWLHMVLYPLYESAELEKYKQVTRNKMLMQLAKNEVQSYRKITEEIFGVDHPYGYNTEVTDVDQLKREDLLDYYNDNLGLDKAFLILSGKYKAATKDTILSELGACKRTCRRSEPLITQLKTEAQLFKIKTDNDVQVSIKTGRPLFGSKHPDRGSVQFLNTILGGYFGSRLMKNIREEKGYTYGIYSSVHFLSEGGFIYISAEVDNAYVEPTLAEINKEMLTLQQVPIPTEEMEMVRSYLLGQSLHNLDGPFAKAQLMKRLRAKNLWPADFEARVDSVRKLTKETVMDTARKYLNAEDFTTVLTGDF